MAGKGPYNGKAIPYIAYNTHSLQNIDFFSLPLPIPSQKKNENRVVFQAARFFCNIQIIKEVSTTCWTKLVFLCWWNRRQKSLFLGDFFGFFFLIRSFFVCDFIFARFPFNTDRSKLESFSDLFYFFIFSLYPPHSISFFLFLSFNRCRSYFYSFGWIGNEKRTKKKIECMEEREYIYTQSI